MDKNTLLSQHRTLNCRGKLLDLSRPAIMGILNVTPDSFYDGGKYSTESELLRQTEQMLNKGAAIIDVGGMSSRPGAAIIDTSTELARVIPAITAISKRFPEAVISADTVKAEVAKEAVMSGAGMINDISAGSIDSGLLPMVAELGIPYILMHSKGKPENMQNRPEYENVVREVMQFFIQKLNEIRNLGIKDVIIDPGFGFGKTVGHNYELLRNLHTFKLMGLPILAGVSRKSMICKVLGVNPDKALNGTTVLHTLALLNGASILRAHDVREAVEVVELMKAYGE